ncbi:hypothetical protein [Pseudomonas sp. NY5710]|uniref:hypothetical protein n=1 Tax=Pseudomonas sp. NY5710 TaxID=2662033 RepID=UPI00201735B8|nr:hypothetical protein [Pseudomonas sp. NY5710]
MTQPDRITLVLRAPEGGTLEHILPFAQLGAHVYIGRGLAVIAGARQGDLQDALAIRDEVLDEVLNEVPHGWGASFSDSELAGRIRTILISGVIGLRDGNTTFNIDDHVRMAADAKRYRFLRDRERIEDPDEDLLVVRGDNWLSGEELDQEIDTALRVQAMQQQVVQDTQEQQP